MSKILTRIGQSKHLMFIELKLIEIKTNQYFDDRFVIIWKRGPQEDTTATYQFEEDETILSLNDKFEKVSGFYLNKKMEFQKKICSFRIMRLSGKSSIVNFDLS